MGWVAWGRLSEKVTWESQEDLGKGLQAEQAASAKVGSQEQIGLGSRNL